MEFSSTVLICLLGVGIKGFTVYRGVLISGGWNRDILLYTEVFSE